MIRLSHSRERGSIPRRGRLVFLAFALASFPLSALLPFSLSGNPSLPCFTITLARLDLIPNAFLQPSHSPLSPPASNSRNGSEHDLGQSARLDDQHRRRRSRWQGAQEGRQEEACRWRRRRQEEGKEEEAQGDLVRPLSREKRDSLTYSLVRTQLVLHLQGPQAGPSRHWHLQQVDDNPQQFRQRHLRAHRFVLFLLSLPTSLNPPYRRSFGGLEARPVQQEGDHLVS